jgi:Sulfatase-modifying factor enzyme 1
LRASSTRPDRDPDGEAQVGVTITRPFAVGKFAVTFAEWDACVAGGGCKGYRPDDQGWGRDRRPVINVSWNNAKFYIDWLNAKTGKTYRLLSEAEREYVTRAGTTTPFWWGAGITPKQANYNGSGEPYGDRTKAEYLGQTVPVDSFEANPWGLFNVHGNVWEWTEDCMGDQGNQGNPGNGSARTGDCGVRVARGGSWYFPPRVTVVRIANKTVSPVLQLAVEFVEHEVTEQWRKRTPLRSSFHARADQSVLHHPGIQECPDELQQPLVLDALGNLAHQFVVIDSIKEFFQIEIDHPSVALRDVLLRLSHGMMRRPTRSEPIAVLGERRIPLPLQNLHYRLLDKAVQHGWHG